MDTGAQERSCGTCSLCCTVLRVDPLRKLGGVPCIHQRVGSEAACAIHGQPERPELCGAYRCAWLQGRFEDGDRPDRLGAVLDVSVRVGLPLLSIREERRGAFEASPRLQEIAAGARETMEVRITCAEDPMDADRPYRVLLPAGEERVVVRDGAPAVA